MWMPHYQQRALQNIDALLRINDEDGKVGRLLMARSLASVVVLYCHVEPIVHLVPMLGLLSDISQGQVVGGVMM
jgi:hypothetical protein